MRFERILTVLFLLALAFGVGAESEEPRSDLPEGWYARIETTKGTMLARLLPEQAPQSVAHFTALAEGRLPWTDPFTGKTKQDAYYDGLLIHKIVAGQRFETGDPTATGRGAPPFYVPPEGAGPKNFHRPWRLGMTRSGRGRINGALFFVTSTSMPWLTRRHPCFGEIIEGREVVRAITEVDANSSGAPLEPIVVESVRIFSVGEPPSLPEPRPYDPPNPKLAPRKQNPRPSGQLAPGAR